jgi:hypothetical protein
MPHQLDQSRTRAAFSQAEPWEWSQAAWRTAFPSGIVGGSSTLMVESFGTLSSQPASRQKRNGRMEARVRIELTYKGFADLSLTTWVPRLLG